MTIDIDPVIAHIGQLALTWYGLFVAVAIALGTAVALREAQRRGIASAQAESLAVWVVAGGLVGARALHVIDRWPDYVADPLAIVAIWNGGLAILGAVLGGALTGLAVGWRRGLPVRVLADAAALGAILGQGVGRIACLFTGDAVGRPTTGFGVTYLNPNALVPQLGVAYEPVFLYEIIWDFTVFALLWWLRPRLRTDGVLFAAYLALYASGKFALSFLRTEALLIAGLQQAHVFALATLACAIAWAGWCASQPRLSAGQVLRQAR